jgi:hypothetical protein
VAGISPAVTATATPAQPAVEPPLQLAFQAPTSASVGEAFDVRVALTSHQPVGRIAMEIVYDASLLKARSAEEIDYTQRAPGEVAFSIERSSDGQVGVALVAGGGVAGEGVPATAAVVQFEALAAGGAQIQLSGIAVSDTTDRPMPFEAKGQESLILVH